jgi:predicted Rossmann-fold nucleotide-binding protein
MWNGLIDWIQPTMVERGLVSPNDLNVISIVSSSDEAIPIIRASYERFKQEKENAHAGRSTRGA